ncbi:MAG TPA: hypothetical protein VLB80_03425 [Candidatus Babeliales bacterium]|nr:hypothetical protein [Candidatus Babeliales bacterium]
MAAHTLTIQNYHYLISHRVSFSTWSVLKRVKINNFYVEVVMNQEKCFAEVIESSLTSWLGQSWTWDTFPEFGSFVAIEGKKRTVFGIVHHVQTGSMDPVRYPFPYKKTEEELLQEQPQIFEFLKTTFACIAIGYQEKKLISYLIAPEPPKIHSFILCPSNEISKIFFSSTNYLHLLFTHSAQIFNMDELMLALLRQHMELNILTKNKMNSFMQTYSLLTGNDYRRIKLFLQRVEHMLGDSQSLL